jgi:hypothetical protein
MAESKSEFPERIQNKILAYIQVLNSRFPSTNPYYRISSAYLTGEEALSDPTPLTIIYTNDGLEPDAGSTIYINQSKTLILSGKSKYFHVFDSSDVSLEKSIQIDSKGLVINIFTPK